VNRSTDILIHRKNSYALRSLRCIGRREAESRGQVNKGKNFPVFSIAYHTFEIICKICINFNFRT
jgi:hypothetical protein